MMTGDGREEPAKEIPKYPREHTPVPDMGGNQLFPYLVNLAGFRKMSDEDMGLIRYPRFELHCHVLLKTIQAGAFLGMFVVGPARALISGPRTFSSAWKLAKKSSLGGALIGAPIGPLMTEMAIRNSDEDAIYDRCYRLRYNEGQVRVDRYSLVGAAAAVVVGLHIATPIQYSTLMGLNAGMLTAAVRNNFFSKK